MSDTPSKYKFCNTVAIKDYEDAEQPDGTWLLSLNCSKLDNSQTGVYIGLLTSALKRKTNYQACQTQDTIQLKGDLDLYVSGPMYLNTDSEDWSSVTLTAVITVIDV